MLSSDMSHSVVARAIRTRDTRAGQYESHGRPVQPGIEENLVEGAVDECRVHRNNRVQASRMPFQRHSSPRAAPQCRRRTSVVDTHGEGIRPVGANIAAVIATIRSSAAPGSSLKTEVHVGPAVATDFPCPGR